MMHGTVALVGRPNVGKSTIFNCLTQSQRAIVSDFPGLTRDRIYGFAAFDSTADEDIDDDGFMLIDTGGFETANYSFQPLPHHVVWKQTLLAIEESDLVVFVLDGREGLHLYDQDILKSLKKFTKPVIYVVNKLDGRSEDLVNAEFFSLGVEEFLTTTASQNGGIDELRERIKVELSAKMQARKTTPKSQARIAIVGKPNAGKSSLLNRLVGEERSLVSEVAGTTRDTVDAELTYNGTTFTFVDTAGVRRKSKINELIESLSVLRSIRAIEDSHVVVAMIDATEKISDQDSRLIEMAVDFGKPVLIVMNKWDLVEEKTSQSAHIEAEEIRMRLRLTNYIPILFISCKNNQRVHKVTEMCLELYNASQKRVTTSKLNAALEAVVAGHTPTLIHGHSKRIRFYFATQIRVAPPTIVVFCNVADEIQESYKRYMHKQFREILEFGPVPIRLVFRSKKEQNEGR